MKSKTTKKTGKKKKIKKFKIWHFDTSKSTSEEIENVINEYLRSVSDPDLDLTVDREESSVIIYGVHLE